MDYFINFGYLTLKHSDVIMFLSVIIGKTKNRIIIGKKGDQITVGKAGIIMNKQQLCEMIDITSVSPTTSNINPTVIWNNYITNVTSFNKANETKLTTAINQAFEQSPYLQYNN